MQQTSPDADADPDRATFTWRGFRRGVVLALPFGASSVIYGLGFGVLASQMGLTVAEAVLMSAAVFSGTAQFAVLQAWAAAPSALLAVFATVLAANARYVLMSAALRPWLGTLRKGRAELTLLGLVDGTFALGMREHAAGTRDAAVMAGAALPSYLGWTVATGLGYAAGRYIPNPRALALDFIIVAFCASAVALMWRGRRDVWPGVAALATAVAVDRFLPGAWVVVAATIAAVVVGALRHDDRT